MCFDYLPYWKVQLSTAVTLSHTWLHPSREAIKIALSICAYVTAGAQLMLINSDAGEFYKKKSAISVFI
jgi:hypothetical protein